MHVMIPASGGLDSSVLLMEVLRDTDHEVTAVYLPEDYNDFFRRIEPASRAAFDRVIDRLKGEHRSFGAEIGEVVRVRKDGTAFALDETVPVRSGFARRSTLYRARCRAASHAHNAERLKADEVWMAWSAWDCRYGLDTMWPEWEREFRAYTARPWQWGFGRPGTPGMPGRVEVAHRAGELGDLILSCYFRSDDGEPCGYCNLCRFWRFHRELCAGLTLAQARQIDREIAKRCHFGEHLTTADAATYDPDDLPRRLEELDEWWVWIDRNVRAERRLRPLAGFVAGATAPGVGKAAGVIRVVPALDLPRASFQDGKAHAVDFAIHGAGHDLAGQVAIVVADGAELREDLAAALRVRFASGASELEVGADLSEALEPELISGVAGAVQGFFDAYVAGEEIAVEMVYA